LCRSGGPKDSHLGEDDELPDWFRYAVIVVILHAGVTVIHAAAHFALQILPPVLDTLFILVVIVALPILSALFIRTAACARWSYLIAFAASFVYGALSHFVLPGVDNVISISASAWATIFQATTFLLAILEALGAAIGVGLVVRREPRPESVLPSA